MRYSLNQLPAYLGGIDMKSPAWKGGFNLGLRGGAYEALTAMIVAQFNDLDQAKAENMTDNAIAGWETGNRRNRARCA